MFEDRRYVWVVLCKNYRFHRTVNFSDGHHILLGETDAYSPLPMTRQKISVRCDSCGAEYFYSPREILRNVLEIPTGFVPHPLFR